MPNRRPRCTRHALRCKDPGDAGTRATPREDRSRLEPRKHGIPERRTGQCSREEGGIPAREENHACRLHGGHDIGPIRVVSSAKIDQSCRNPQLGVVKQPLLGPIIETIPLQRRGRGDDRHGPVAGRCPFQQAPVQLPGPRLELSGPQQRHCSRDHHAGLIPPSSRQQTPRSSREACLG
jgi:hypothetical protein